MINGLFLNLNGADINILNIEYISGVTYYNFSGDDYQRYSHNDTRFIFDDKPYVLRSEGCPKSIGEIQKYCFKINLKSHTLLSQWYDNLDECQNKRTELINEINGVLKEYGHILLDNGIKKINL